MTQSTPAENYLGQKPNPDTDKLNSLKQKSETELNQTEKKELLDLQREMAEKEVWNEIAAIAEEYRRPIHRVRRLPYYKKKAEGLGVDPSDFKSESKKHFIERIKYYLAAKESIEQCEDPEKINFLAENADSNIQEWAKERIKTLAEEIKGQMIDPEAGDFSIENVTPEDLEKLHKYSINIVNEIRSTAQERIVKLTEKISEIDSGGSIDSLKIFSACSIPEIRNAASDKKKEFIEEIDQVQVKDVSSVNKLEPFLDCNVRDIKAAAQTKLKKVYEYIKKRVELTELEEYIKDDESHIRGVRNAAITRKEELNTEADEEEKSITDTQVRSLLNGSRVDGVVIRPLADKGNNPRDIVRITLKIEEAGAEVPVKQLKAIIKKAFEEDGAMESRKAYDEKKTKYVRAGVKDEYLPEPPPRTKDEKDKLEDQKAAEVNVANPEDVKVFFEFHESDTEKYENNVGEIRKNLESHLRTLDIHEQVELIRKYHEYNIPLGCFEGLISSESYQSARSMLEVGLPIMASYYTEALHRGVEQVWPKVQRTLEQEYPSRMTNPQAVVLCKRKFIEAISIRAENADVGEEVYSVTEEFINSLVFQLAKQNKVGEYVAKQNEVYDYFELSQGEVVFAMIDYSGIAKNGRINYKKLKEEYAKSIKADYDRRRVSYDPEQLENMIERNVRLIYDASNQELTNIMEIRNLEEEMNEAKRMKNWKQIKAWGPVVSKFLMYGGGALVAASQFGPLAEYLVDGIDLSSPTAWGGMIAGAGGILTLLQKVGGLETFIEDQKEIQEAKREYRKKELEVSRREEQIGLKVADILGEIKKAVRKQVPQVKGPNRNELVRYMQEQNRALQEEHSRQWGGFGNQVYTAAY